MQYFTEDFISFFKELSANNHKDWFHANKKRYEVRVKKPFELFLADLISGMQQFDKDLNIEPKDCVLRINRDVRFSKDKTPYNIHYTAFVSKGGRKDKSIPGLFLRLGPEWIGIMGGCFGPSKEQLHNIRKQIGLDVGKFQKLMSDPDFVSKFGSIQGEEHKRIPVEFQSTYKSEPLIAKKQFYFVAKRSSDLIASPDLLPEIMKYWHIARPVNEYLTKAL